MKELQNLPEKFSFLALSILPEKLYDLGLDTIQKRKSPKNSENKKKHERTVEFAWEAKFFRFTSTPR